jgi:hypothetical protein
VGNLNFERHKTTPFKELESVDKRFEFSWNWQNFSVLDDDRIEEAKQSVSKVPLAMVLGVMAHD